jgi:hypothetical protein
MPKLRKSSCIRTKWSEIRNGAINCKINLFKTRWLSMRSPTTRKTLTMLMKAMQTPNLLAVLTVIVKKLLAMMTSRLMARDLISNSRRRQKRIVQNNSSNLPISSDTLTMSKLSRDTVTKLKRRQRRERIQKLVQNNHSSISLPTKLHKMMNLWSFKRVSTSKMSMRWHLMNSTPQLKTLLIRVA